MDLGDNIKMLRERIAAACAESGRHENEISVVAATKCVPAEIVYSLPGFGITTVGENRVQEFTQKYSESVPLNWHIIGALQTNKVKYAVGKVKLIQSVDRIPLAEEINRLSQKHGTVTDVLIEINIGSEENKSGAMPECAEELVDAVSKLKNVRIKGLMSVPPIGADAAVYEKMRALYDGMRGKFKTMDTLSMGMSNDYELAIRCGATMIRPGRVLFGERKTI